MNIATRCRLGIHDWAPEPTAVEPATVGRSLRCGAGAPLEHAIQPCGRCSAARLVVRHAFDRALGIMSDWRPACV
jgi:hypothetical protein